MTYKISLTTLFQIASTLGVVSKCTLFGNVKDVWLYGRNYCVINKEKNKHSVAFEICKKLNARLPLPKNKVEADGIRKGLISSSSWIHVDARNPKKTANKTEWVDAEGKPLGNRTVNLQGQKF